MEHRVSTALIALTSAAVIVTRVALVKFAFLAEQVIR
jgi:hypothetical protein